MDNDEILRMQQITGLAEAFAIIHFLKHGSRSLK